MMGEPVDLFKGWIKSINEKTGNIFDSAEHDRRELDKTYPSFMILRAFSQSPDVVQYAAEISVRSEHLSPKMQYDALYYGIPKRKRFDKWAKASKDTHISNIMEAYNYSRTKAEAAYTLFSEAQLEELNQYLYKGGRNGKSK
jgi:hypothetical protein